MYSLNYGLNGETVGVHATYIKVMRSDRDVSGLGVHVKPGNSEGCI